MDDNVGSTYGFLTRVYALVKIIALTTVSIAGIAVSVLAFNVTVSQVWTGVQTPLYVIALVGIPLVVIYGIFVVIVLLLLRDALASASYYRHSASNLAKSVAHLQDLAYNDPITGMPNSRRLERELRQPTQRTNRCLILLDLMSFIVQLIVAQRHSDDRLTLR